MSTAETILVVAVAAAGILLLLLLLLLLLPGNERRQSRILRIARLRLLHERLRLIVRTSAVLHHRLLTRRKRLRVARDVRLRLRLARPVIRLVLSEGLAVVVAIVVVVVGRALRAALLLLIVIRVLLSKLFLRGRNQTKVMLGMLIIIFGRYRIARALRVARELNVFFRDMGGGASNLHVGSVGLVDPRQRILALAVIVVTSPHALLTVSHDCACSLTFRLMPRARSSPLLPVHLPLHVASIARPGSSSLHHDDVDDVLRSLSLSAATP